MIDEQLLGAYVDGELDAADAARVAAAIAADPALGQRVAEQRALRERLRTRFAPIVEEPVPLRLQAAAARRPALGAPPSRRALLQWGAIAATLVLGVVLGLQLQGPGSEPLTTRDGRLLASGALRTALMGQLSAPAKTGAVGIGMTIRTTEGAICRSFFLASGQAGLACLDGEDWTIDTLVAAPLAGGDYRLAASPLPEPLRIAIETRAAGEPLSVAQEQALRGSGWREGASRPE